jgi:hypothetical protein
MASKFCVSLGISGLLTVALALPAIAADSKSPAAKTPAKKTRLAENLRPFDKNNDGVLDAAERKAMNAAKKNGTPAKSNSDLDSALGVDKEGKKVDPPPKSSSSGTDGERRSRYDPDSPAGKYYAELRKKVDTNGDGNLDETEREAMSKQIEKDREAGTLPEGVRSFSIRGGRGGPGGGRPSFDPDSPIGKFFADIRSRVDVDGDGELNDEERQAMRAEIDKARQDGTMPEGFGNFGRGRGGPGGGGPGGGFTPSPETLQKFDKDGDGKLDDDERAAMRADWEKNRGSGSRSRGSRDGNSSGSTPTKGDT